MKRQTGFSLVELLVAMAITLILVAATLSLFQDALHTNEASTQLGNMNGNLRSAMSLMVRDILQAGHGIPTGGVAIPTGAGCQNVNRPVPTGTATFLYGCPNAALYPTLPAVIPGNAAGPGIIGNTTDMITMVFQDNDLLTNANSVTLLPVTLDGITATTMTFDAATPIGGGISNAVVPGDLFLVYGNGLYRFATITAVNAQVATFAANDPFKFNQQASAASGTVRDILAGAPTPACPPPPAPPALPQNCPYTAQRVLMVTYFLDVSNPSIPRLMRQINMKPPNPVAEIIEDLEVSYDYVNGSAPINNQVTTPAVPAGITDNQIRKVNLYLAGRSDAILSQTGQYKRTNIATQVDVRSLAFVNRYQ
jgi:prepilin-type N-terminal cleavage/methylation domain-containing protein